MVTPHSPTSSIGSASNSNPSATAMGGFADGLKPWVRHLDALPLPLLLELTPDETQDAILYPNTAWVRLMSTLISEMGTDSESAIDRESNAETLEDWQSSFAYWKMEAREHTFAGQRVQVWRSDWMDLQLIWTPIVDMPNGDGDSSDRDSNPKMHLVSAHWIGVGESEGGITTLPTSDWLELNRLKDEFLACVSHELRSPLTALLGLSKLLQDPNIGALNDRQMRYVQLIHRSGKQLINIVNDILDLTRMETGILSLNPQLVSVAAVCQQALERAQHRIPDQVGDSELMAVPNFTLSIEPGLETLVADAVRLQQMLRHLLSNALKFTPVEGAIGVRVGWWEGWIAFTVWDTGIGIPAEKQHLIFQKFQQLEHPLTRQFEGTGLGLVLTQRLARLHGGDVTFTSRVGQGSEFTLLLPPEPSGRSTWTETQDIPVNLSESLDSCAAPPSHLTASNVKAGNLNEVTVLNLAPQIQEMHRVDLVSTHSSRMVLVVEPGMRYLTDVLEQLTALDYRVAIARSGTEALEKARNLHPCAVLLNPELPILSGWDVLTLLKSNLETRSIPVIMIGAAVERDRRLYLGAADGILKLPMSPRALAERLDQCLQEQSCHPSEPESKTILCLHLNDALTHEDPSETESSGVPHFHESLEQILQQYAYRVIEANDREQAEMMARVWKPQVLILVGSLPNPMPYFKLLAQQTYLSSLPIIPLDPRLAQVAKQASDSLGADLAIFSGSDRPSQTPHSQDWIQRLVQTIEVAIGFVGRPWVLMVDSVQLAEAKPSTTKPSTTKPSTTKPSTTKPSTTKPGVSQNLDWLQALQQYLQTAGLRGTIARNGLDLQQKLRAQGVDLIVIYWHSGISIEGLRESLKVLTTLEHPPKILLLDYRTTPESGAAIADALGLTAGADLGLSDWGLDILITAPQPSMVELLQMIQQRLGIYPS